MWPVVVADKMIAPIFTTPFMRNGDFTGRDSILAQLDEKLGSKEGYQPRAVLYGLGGTG